MGKLEAAKPFGAEKKGKLGVKGVLEGVGGPRQFPYYRINNPKLIIGSDTKELIDFVRMKCEWHKARALRMVKVSVGITMAHFLFVRLPEFYLRETTEE